MQIRLRATGATLIRNVYDPSLRRSRSHVLGFVPLDATEVEPELIDKLRPDERIEVQRWLGARVTERRLTGLDRSARGLPMAIAQAAQWYRSRTHRNPEMVELAKRSRDEFSKLLAAMVDAGVGRTRKRRQ